jgi:GntR family transcriptional regulator
MTETSGAVAAIRTDYPEPLWIQAVNLINSEIASGVLQPGMRLPPERELCQQLGISRVTLRKALTSLVEDGVLSASHGRGWYVAQAAPANKEWPSSLESFTETAHRMGLTASSTVVAAEERAASLDEAEELKVAPGTPLFHLVRVRLLNGLPIALDETKLPMQLVPDLGAADFTHDSLYEKLAEAGIEPLRADATIEAKEADERAGAMLDIPVGKPMLVMRQLAVDDAERPLFSSTIMYAGERYRLRTFFARSGAFPAAR